MRYLYVVLLLLSFVFYGCDEPIKGYPLVVIDATSIGCMIYGSPLFLY